MNIEHLLQERKEEWNSLAVREPSFSLLQSWEWGDYKEKLGWKAFRIGLVDDNGLTAGAQLLIKPVPGGLFSAAYVPRGPIGLWRGDEPASLLFRAIHDVARKHRAVFLKIEPQVLHDPSFEAFLLKSGFRISPFSIQPRATIVLDLRPDLEAILTGMRQKTRQYIRGAVREDISVKFGGLEDVGALSELIQKFGRREGIPFRRRVYFLQQWEAFGEKNQVALLLASRQGQLLAARTVFRFGSHAAEFHAAASPAASGSHANYLLVWEAIRWAKSHGCTTYDFWGVPDEVGRLNFEGKDPDAAGRTDRLWGVYQFKKGFSRRIVYYSGSYDYVYSRALYRLLLKWRGKEEFLERVASRADRFRRQPHRPSLPDRVSPPREKDRIESEEEPPT